MRTLFLLFFSCTTIRATERFEVRADARPDEVLAASREANRRLGGETLLSVERKAVHLEFASPDAGTLEISSRGWQGMGRVSAAIAAGTQQLLDDRPAKPSVTPRSHALVVALDLLEPSLGGLAADIGDPYGPYWAYRLCYLADDAIGAALIYQGLSMRGYPYAWDQVAIGVGMMVAVRVLAVMFDWDQVSRRNAAAESGFNLSSLPEPKSVEVSDARR